MINKPALYEAVLKATLPKVEGGKGCAVPDRWLMPDTVTLYRAVEPKYVPILACDVATQKRLVSQSAVQECLRVRDQNTPKNRFTGQTAKGTPGPMGGVYFSLNQGAGLAEMMHYAEKGSNEAVANNDFANMLPYEVATRRASIPYLLARQCILVARLTVPILVADMSLHSQSSFGEVRRFLNEIGKDPEVSKLIVGQTLPDLMLDENDYSVARAIGHALQGSRRYAGMLAETARETERRGESGSNLILFGDNHSVLSGLEVETALYFFDPGVAGQEQIMKAAVTTRF